jgi:hypothetical protein
MVWFELQPKSSSLILTFKNQAANEVYTGPDAAISETSRCSFAFR